MKELGSGLHTIQDKYAHSEQGAGWSEHNPLSKNYTNPDNAYKHLDAYKTAYKASTTYVESFKKQTEKDY